MSICKNCDWYAKCKRASGGSLQPDCEKCQFPRRDGTSAFKLRKLRGSEKRKTGGKRA